MGALRPRRLPEIKHPERKVPEEELPRRLPKAIGPEWKDETVAVMDRAKPFDRQSNGTLDSRRTVILWQKEPGHPNGRVHKQTPDGRMQEVTDPQIVKRLREKLKV